MITPRGAESALTSVDGDRARLVARGERGMAGRRQHAGRGVDGIHGNIIGIIVRDIGELAGRIEHNADRKGASGHRRARQGQGAAARRDGVRGYLVLAVTFAIYTIAARRVDGQRFGAGSGGQAAIRIRPSARRSMH